MYGNGILQSNVEGQAASSLAWTGLFGVFSETDMMMIDSDVKWIMVNDLGASASELDLGIERDWPMTGEQQWRRDQDRLQSKSPRRHSKPSRFLLQPNHPQEQFHL